MNVVVAAVADVEVGLAVGAPGRQGPVGREVDAGAAVADADHRRSRRSRRPGRDRRERQRHRVYFAANGALAPGRHRRRGQPVRPRRRHDALHHRRLDPSSRTRATGPRTDRPRPAASPPTVPRCCSARTRSSSATTTPGSRSSTSTTWRATRSSASRAARTATRRRARPSSRSRRRAGSPSAACRTYQRRNLSADGSTAFFTSAGAARPLGHERQVRRLYVE